MSELPKPRAKSRRTKSRRAKAAQARKREAQELLDESVLPGSNGSLHGTRVVRGKEPNNRRKNSPADERSPSPPVAMRKADPAAPRPSTSPSVENYAKTALAPYDPGSAEHYTSPKVRGSNGNGWIQVEDGW